VSEDLTLLAAIMMFLFALLLVFTAAAIKLLVDGVRGFDERLGKVVDDVRKAVEDVKRVAEGRAGAEGGSDHHTHPHPAPNPEELGVGG